MGQGPDPVWHWPDDTVPQLTEQFWLVAMQNALHVLARQTSWNATYPPVLGSWGSYVGHGGGKNE